MAGFLREFALGSMREEMKRRVDEVIRAGQSWEKTAKELVEALNRLEQTINQKGTVDLKPVRASLRKLSKDTDKMAKVLDEHRSTIIKAMQQIQ